MNNIKENSVGYEQKILASNFQNLLARFASTFLKLLSPLVVAYSQNNLAWLCFRSGKAASVQSVPGRVCPPWEPAEPVGSAHWLLSTQQSGARTQDDPQPVSCFTPIENWDLIVGTSVG